MTGEKEGIVDWSEVELVGVKWNGVTGSEVEWSREGRTSQVEQVWCRTASCQTVRIHLAQGSWIFANN
jgi:hypothetical protein